MNYKTILFALSVLVFSFSSCTKKNEDVSDLNIIFLHHSTGEMIWEGKPRTLFNRAVGKISSNLAEKISRKPQIIKLMDAHNNEQKTDYRITEARFPKHAPYGWRNYPYDYYNIWVKHAGEEPFMEEPTLEMLTQDYQVIIFKHCFPVSNMEADQDSADINSPEHTLANFKLQYNALRDKINTFSDTKFILFTGAVQVKGNLSESEALRAQEFYKWVKEEWDLADDNILLWDLYDLQTDGGLYFKDELAVSQFDSHPNKAFSRKAGKLLFARIIDVIENEGKGTQLTGEYK